MKGSFEMSTGVKKRYQINDVVRIVMENDNHSVTIQESLENLSRYLGVPLAYRKKLRQDCLIGTKKLEDAFEDTLVYWTRRQGKMATLENLINAFQMNQMEGIAQLLENEFSTADGAVDSPLLSTIRLNKVSKTKKCKKRTKSLAACLCTILGIIFIVIFSSFTMNLTIQYGQTVLDFIVCLFKECSEILTEETTEFQDTDMDDVVALGENSSLYINYVDISQYEKEVNKFNTSIYRSLNMTILSPNDLQTKPFLIFSEHISELFISDLTDLDGFFHMFNQTRNLERLTINGSMKNECSNNNSMLNSIISNESPRVAYNSLGRLTILSSLCIPFLSFFLANFEIHRISELAILDSIMNDQDIDSVGELMLLSRFTLTEIEIKGVSITDRQLFSYRKPLVKVERLHFDLLYKGSKINENILGKTFCLMLPNIISFTRNETIEYIDFLNILKCPRISHISANIVIFTTSPFLNISSAYTGNKLESVNLTIEFKPACPPCSKLNYLELSSFEKRIKEISIVLLNCVCNGNVDEESTSLENYEITAIKQEGV